MLNEVCARKHDLERQIGHYDRVISRLEATVSETQHRLNNREHFARWYDMEQTQAEFDQASEDVLVMYDLRLSCRREVAKLARLINHLRYMNDCSETPRDLPIVSVTIRSSVHRANNRINKAMNRFTPSSL